jgi:hypothetical protein
MARPVCGHRGDAAEIGERFSELSVAQIDYLIATLVIENNFGTEWYEAHVEASHRDDPTNVFLRSGPKTPAERRDHQLRVMELARRVFELGQETFIDQLINNLRQRDLEGAAFEAEVIRMLVSLPVVVNLRTPSGVKGDDYDIDLWMTPDTPLAIEVKTRGEAGPYSDKALAGTLEKARSQLPKSGLGAIFVKAPAPWLEDSQFFDNHATVVNTFLKKTQRVQFVVVVWDEWIAQDTACGWRWERRRRVFRSTAIADLSEFWIDGYERIWGTGIDILAPNAPF